MDLFCPHTAPTPKNFSGQGCVKRCGHMSSFLDKSIGLRMTAFDLDFCLSQKALALDRSATERRMGDGLDLALDLQSREGTRSVGREIKVKGPFFVEKGSSQSQSKSVPRKSRSNICSGLYYPDIQRGIPNNYIFSMTYKWHM